MQLRAHSGRTHQRTRKDPSAITKLNVVVMFLRDHQVKCYCYVPIFHHSGYHAGANALLNAEYAKVDGATRLVQQQQKILTEVALLIIQECLDAR